VLRRTRDAYEQVAELYADTFAGLLPHRPLDRAMLGVFADLARVAVTDAGQARVADVGCGPGHVTAHLDRLGVRAFGVDLSPAMIARARRDHPGLAFAVADLCALPVADATLGGIVAWYSIIHLPPDRVAGALAEFHRVLAEGAPLLLAVQSTGDDSPVPRSHDHRVAPSYRWSARALWALLDDAGFTEIARLEHPAGEFDRLPGAMLLAHRRAAPAVPSAQTVLPDQTVSPDQTVPPALVVPSAPVAAD